MSLFKRRYGMKITTILVFSAFVPFLISCVTTKTGERNLTPEIIRVVIMDQHEAIVESIVKHIPTGRPGVAVLDIATDNNDEIGIFATEELIIQLVRTRRFRVVDRDSIETILREHNFQLSGAVSDETAVSIGRFIGASVIITGLIRERNEQIDFSLKILDVETAEIIDLMLIPIWR